MLLVTIAIVLFLAAAAVLIVWRRELANLQAMLAGGTLPPGCAVAEAVVMILLAALVFVAYREGWL